MPRYSREQLLDTARSLAPLFEAEAGTAEAARTLTPKTVDAFVESGLADLMTPEVLGGSEADPVTQALVFEEVSRADGSTGWCLMAGATSSAVAAAFCSEEAVSTIFGGQTGVILGGHAAPLGRAIATSDGYRLTGHWQFGSGTNHCPWLLAGCTVMRDGEMVLQAEGAPEMWVTVVPRDQAVFLDNWHVMGLVGTGSYDYELDDVFVPEGRAFPTLTGDVRRGGPVYRLGMLGLVASGHAAWALGVGRRALDEITRIAPGKQRGLGPPLADRETFLRDLGMAESKLQSARLFVHDALQRSYDYVCAHPQRSLELESLVRMATRYATDVSSEVCEFAYRASGTEALRTPHALQRCLRDIHAGTQHAFVYEQNYLDGARTLIRGASRPE